MAEAVALGNRNVPDKHQKHPGPGFAVSTGLAAVLNVSQFPEPALRSISELRQCRKRLLVPRNAGKVRAGAARFVFALMIAAQKETRTMPKFVQVHTAKRSRLFPQSLRARFSSAPLGVI